LAASYQWRSASLRDGFATIDTPPPTAREPRIEAEQEELARAMTGAFGLLSGPVFWWSFCAEPVALLIGG
jgi:hypothetical protein